MTKCIFPKFKNKIRVLVFANCYSVSLPVFLIIAYQELRCDQSTRWIRTMSSNVHERKEKTKDKQHISKQVNLKLCAKA